MSVDWSTTANVATISTQNAGTGAARNLKLLAGGTAGVTIQGSADTTISSSSYKIYLTAGGNKTWFISESTGSFSPATDNSYDIGVSSSNRVRSLYLSGGFSSGISTKTSAYTLTVNDRTILCNANTTPFTLTLPDATQNAGREYKIKKIDSTANAVSISANTTLGQMIDNMSTAILNAQYGVLNIQSDGANYWIL